MTTDNRAAMWLLPPIALQILHYLDDADDAFAFLTAAPDCSLDDALDALRTLLAMDSEFSLWPTAHIASLDKAYNVSPSVVMMALSLFKKIDLGFCEDASTSIRRNTELPPTTTVSAYVNHNATSLRAALGKWLPNLEDLEVVSRNDPDFAPLANDNLSACHGLRALTIHQDEVLDQATLDAVLAAVIATCPNIERICVELSKLSFMSDCTSLLAWLALPTARHLTLDCIDFHVELGAELATAMLDPSTALETIELSEAPNLTRAILSPSSPPLPPQLRHLTICDYTMDNDDALHDVFYDDYDAPLTFGNSDVAALAAKIANSRLESLVLGPQYPSDLTPVVNILPQLPTLTKLALQEVHLASFPPLVQLLYLELRFVTFPDEAVESLATLLGSSPKLVHLDLSYSELTDYQVETILRALPHWLSHRGTTCNVALPIMTEASATALIAALAKTRNSHRVTCLIATSGLSLHYKKQLVAALASTSRMALCILGADRFEFVALEAYGRQHQLTIAYRKESTTAAKECWFHSPHCWTINS
ncbi:hypothetical protein SPRG_09320 [Saprolegnia parasitica CBS 223.65]|uniref:F-box domain-containing protein n=1 Tax=Saprolegnia parasitica (strain CBS 223.65) TaxID=695850 RepID=A0A067C3L7_SAPPC|nr:hypothetical protein SPRG_09320 [Saprolegnia parasitica CBS 223.65]KDO25379.1 hypothetical protein SPRG_09320 [Saprolegnia parasitica CBS 223.65]|eukprot:XP_012203807.1 hypothetical protein SPRG_09320 [Saprolegnia parasitica CBS 223.65]